jgi:hypothetical protein
MEQELLNRRAFGQKGVRTGIALATLLGGVTAAFAEPVKLEQPSSDDRPFRVKIDIQTNGHVYTSRAGGKSERHTLNAVAHFDFVERRLPPAGREAAALRSARDFLTARMDTQVSDKRTSVELLPVERFVVSTGRREGITAYSPSTLLSRDTLDLLEFPSDPLIFIPLLPQEPVEIGAEWAPSDWVTQMIGTVEAVDKIETKCRLDSVTGSTAVISVASRVRGQRLGANADVTISGTFQFDITNKSISAADLAYEMKSTIGTVSPGIDAKVVAKMTRTPSESPGRISNEVLAKIPVESPEPAQSLMFLAEPWQARLRHTRNWFVFQAVLEGSPQVVILRMLDRGSLVAQCNVTSLPKAAPGSHAPTDQFESDIQTSLGKRFKSILSKGQIPTTDGRMIYRVDVEGSTEFVGNQGSAEIPMNWIYYLLADPAGRQMSFVFAVEPNLRKQLADADLEMVKGVQFADVK